MEQNEPNLLLNLPTDVFEEILLYLTTFDRDNLRLTSKRLYKLCNSKRLCINEQFIWNSDYMSHAKFLESLSHIGRHYNLVINKEDLGDPSVMPFFEENGDKVRSLTIKNCYFIPGFLEPIIMLCEDLCSLTLSLQTGHDTSDFFTIEPGTITRPQVTFLELKLPKNQPSTYFHRMSSIFPNVKNLKISMEDMNRFRTKEESEKFNLKTAEDCSAILEDIMKWGNSLKSLKLNIPLSQLVTKGSQFFHALPSLRELCINFNEAILSEPEKLLSFSNLTSLELTNPKGFGPANLERLLENNPIDHLSLRLHSSHLVWDKEFLKLFVSSQLKTVYIHATGISSPSETILDSPLEANTTVTDLHLPLMQLCEPFVQQFTVYFRGLVHLDLLYTSDSVLQYIFQYQENLRSLSLGLCPSCTVSGFCGSNDGNFKYSMAKLQNLEHLAISHVFSEIVSSDTFKNAFRFPRLKYLFLDCIYPQHEDPTMKISPALFKNLINLRALRLKDTAMPSREEISSLLGNLKHMNYLRYDLHGDRDSTTAVAFINFKQLQKKIAKCAYNNAFKLGNLFYDTELDRTVILNGGLDRNLYCPKISSYEIDWIEA